LLGHEAEGRSNEKDTRLRSALVAARRHDDDGVLVVSQPRHRASAARLEQLRELEWLQQRKQLWVEQRVELRLQQRVE
jgi:hypothetical protein